MKKPTPNITLGLSLLLFLVSFQVDAKKGPSKVSKNVYQEHELTPDHNISIANKFGKVNVTSWDKNTIELDVVITVLQSNEAKAQEIIDNIEIDIKKTDTEFKVYTRIKRENGHHKLNSKKNTDISIDYDVKLPRNNQIDIRNSFGEVIVGSRSGNTRVDVNFGSATISNLTGKHNDLKFQFSNPVIISNITAADIKLRHSTLEVLRAENLVLASEMSDVNIDQLQEGQINMKLGSIKLNEVKTLQLNSQMSSVKIDKLHEEGDIKNNYGSLSINSIPKQIKKLDINAEFSPINIQLERSGNYKLETKVKMGDLTLPKSSVPEENSSAEEESLIKMSKIFKGHIGEKNADAGLIKITNSFGEINITLTD